MLPLFAQRQAEFSELKWYMQSLANTHYNSGKGREAHASLRSLDLQGAIYKALYLGREQQLSDTVSMANQLLNTIITTSNESLIASMINDIVIAIYNDLAAGEVLQVGLIFHTTYVEIEKWLEAKLELCRAAVKNMQIYSDKTYSKLIQIPGKSNLLAVATIEIDLFSPIVVNITTVMTASELMSIKPFRLNPLAWLEVYNPSNTESSPI